MPRSNTLHYTSGRLGARRLRCGRRDTSSSSSLSLLVALSAASPPPDTNMSSSVASLTVSVTGAVSAVSGTGFRYCTMRVSFPRPVSSVSSSTPAAARSNALSAPVFWRCSCGCCLAGRPGRRQHRVGLGPSDVAPTAAPRRSTLWRRRLLLKARAGQQEMQLLVLAVQAISAERTARGPGHCVPQLGDVRGHSVEPEPPAVLALAPRPVAARPALPLGRHAAQRRGGGIFKRGQAGCAELRWLRRRQPTGSEPRGGPGSQISL